ncbi:DinB family protein [Nonomuraea sp. NPDC050404]|uniref:DinB family protein n=1 Tax=Nonomuraea sp. NPDC050404 TaxID=3155783 RepID=UPI0033DB5751
MAAHYDNTDAFREASFTSSSLAGAKFRDCDLTGLKVVDSFLVDVNVSGIVGNFIVNDVDVTPYVEAELDRRNPERVQLREMRTPDDFRAMWATVERLWAETVARAERLPEARRHERFDDEWSFVETLRHLVFATDAWVSRTIFDEPLPFHPFGLTHTAYPPTKASELGMDLAARPTYGEVMEVRAGRLALVRGVVDDLTDAELARPCTRPPAPGYPEQPRSVGECLRVVMGEECEHRRYMERDLAALAAT